MQNIEAIEKEQIFSKKAKRAGITAAFMGGGGLAAWLLQRAFDGLTASPLYNGAIDTISLALMAHFTLIVAAFLIARPWVLRVNLIMVSIILPIIILKTITGIM